MTQVSAPTLGEIIKILQEASKDAVKEGNKFIEALNAQIQFNVLPSSIPAQVPMVWLGSAANALARPARPVISLGNIQEYLNKLALLSAPTPAFATFQYADPGYSSIVKDPMVNKILNDLQNGSYGIDVNDEVQLLHRVRDRESMISIARVEETKRQAASMSFPMPQGSLFEQLEQANQDYQAKVSSANRDIYIDRAKRFVDARQFTIEKALLSESQQIGLYNAIQDRTLRAVEVESTLAISTLDARIRLFQSQIEILKTGILADIDIVKAEIETYTADIGAYDAFIRAIIAATSIDIENSRNFKDIGVARMIEQGQLEMARAQAYIGAAQVRTNAAVAGANLFGSGYGAALSGINALAVNTGTA